MSTACRITLLCLCFCLCAARADDTPAERLKVAKKEFEEAVDRYKKGATDYFDKREDAARARGDKKAVDVVKNDRAAFTKKGDLPPAALQQPFVLALGPARQKVNKTYAEVVSDHVRGERDDEAEAADKMRREFLVFSAFQYGRRTHLTALKPFDVKPAKETAGHHAVLKLKQEDVPQSLALYPPTGGSAQASYALGGKWSAFRARVGVPEFPDTARPPASEVTFEVLGDERVLWESKPTKALNEYQRAEVCVEKVKVLTLRVRCPKSSDWCRACWLEPILAE